MEEHKYNERHPWDDRIYGTGRTQPRKSLGGLIAFLLILVILLSGIVGILGAMNIRLFSQLRAQESDKNAITFSDRGDAASFFDESGKAGTSYDPGQAEQPSLGIEGEGVSTFYQNYYRMPAGLYVTHVEEFSDAARQGIDYGDILTHLDGNPINDMDTLNALLSSYQVGDTVQITVYRAGQEYSITLTLHEQKG